MDDLETITLKTQLEILEHRFRACASEARRKADAAPLSDDARYQAGYADMADRATQAVRGLMDQW